MKILIYVFIILLISKQAISETALSCNLIKQCIKSADKCFDTKDDSKKTLLVIDEEITKMTISKDFVFGGEYLIVNKTDEEFKGIRISDLETHDLKKLSEIYKRRIANTITEEEFKDIYYVQIFKGLTFEFVINRFLLELETRMIYASPPSYDVGVSRNYKCELIERKI